MQPAHASPSTDWREEIAADEAEKFEAFANEIAELQKQRARDRPPARALHAKGQLGLRAEFTVLDALPDHAKVGIFAQPQTLPAYVRVSNGAGRRQSDAKPDLRGFAFKLVGVGGKKLIPGLQEAVTQDFLMIRQPALSFRSVDEFMLVLRHADNPLKLLAKMVGELGPKRTAQLLPKLAKTVGAPLYSVAESDYYTAAPIRWGTYAAQCHLRPHAPLTTALAKGDPDAVAADLGRRLSQGAVSFDFTAQFYVDANLTPIEDPTVVWPQSVSPRITVGRLTLLKCDLTANDAQKTASLVEEMSFDPWHAPEEFRPLGSVMRARNAAYRASTQGRQAAAEMNVK